MSPLQNMSYFGDHTPWCQDPRRCPLPAKGWKLRPLASPTKIQDGLARPWGKRKIIDSKVLAGREYFNFLGGYHLWTSIFFFSCMKIHFFCEEIAHFCFRSLKHKQIEQHTLTNANEHWVRRPYKKLVRTNSSCINWQWKSSNSSLMMRKSSLFDQTS